MPTRRGRPGDLLRALEGRLTPELRRILGEAHSLACEQGAQLFAVGGGVRDLLLGAAQVDLDLVVLGHAHRFARRLAARLGVPVRAFRRFLTAKLSLPGGGTVDVAAARRERYARPAALPQVRPARGIEEDLFRRDFTANALAIGLSGERAGELIDPYGGTGDLREGRLRILHPLSFRDDPTRAFRAARYAGRLGFHLERKSHTALREAAASGAFGALSGVRVRNELIRILEEGRPAPALALVRRWGLFEAVHPGWRPGPGALRRALGARRALAELEARGGSLGVAAWLPSLLALVAEGAQGEGAEVLLRLDLRGREAERWAAALSTLPREVRRLGASEELPPSEVAHRAASLPPALLPLAAAWRPRSRARGRILLYWERLRHLHPTLGGEALRALGVPAGPPLGEALRRLRRALLDGEIAPGAESEGAFVRALLPSLTKPQKGH
ncbi:MAG: hypothetical protein ACE5JJ_10605 [Nitrospinota bacterium]